MKRLRGKGAAALRRGVRRFRAGTSRIGGQAAQRLRCRMPWPKAQSAESVGHRFRTTADDTRLAPTRLALQSNDRGPAARFPPGLLLLTLPQSAEGAGNAGCAARTRSLVCEGLKAHKRSHHRSAETIRHSPRDGFNGFLRALPGDRAFLSPSSSGTFRPT